MLIRSSGTEVDNYSTPIQPCQLSFGFQNFPSNMIVCQKCKMFQISEVRHCFGNHFSDIVSDIRKAFRICYDALPYSSSFLFLQAPLRVLVTGAAGQIAYSLLYTIAKGDVFGKDQVRIIQAA